MTFDVGCGPVDSLYVAFRGTDGTLVGWKEDFNMAVRCPVPSQESAYRYVNSILDRSEGFLSSAIRLRSCSAGIRKAAIWPCMRPCVSRTMTSKWLGERARRLGLLPSLGGPVRGRNRRISRIFSHDGRAFRNRRCAVSRTVQSNRVSAKPCPNRPSWACCCNRMRQCASSKRMPSASCSIWETAGKWRKMAISNRWTS